MSTKRSYMVSNYAIHAVAMDFCSFYSFILPFFFDGMSLVTS